MNEEPEPQTLIEASARFRDAVLTTLNQMLAAMDNEDFSIRAVLVADKLRWQVSDE